MAGSHSKATVDMRRKHAARPDCTRAKPAVIAWLCRWSCYTRAVTHPREKHNTRHQTRGRHGVFPVIRGLTVSSTLNPPCTGRRQNKPHQIHRRRDMEHMCIAPLYFSFGLLSITTISHPVPASAGNSDRCILLSISRLDIKIDRPASLFYLFCFARSWGRHVLACVP